MAADEAGSAGDEGFHGGGIWVGVYFSFDGNVLSGTNHFRKKTGVRCEREDLFSCDAGSWWLGSSPHGMDRVVFVERPSLRVIRCVTSVLRKGRRSARNRL